MAPGAPASGALSVQQAAPRALRGWRQRLVAGERPAAWVPAARALRRGRARARSAVRGARLAPFLPYASPPPRRRPRCGSALRRGHAHRADRAGARAAVSGGAARPAAMAAAARAPAAARDALTRNAPRPGGRAAAVTSGPPTLPAHRRSPRAPPAVRPPDSGMVARWQEPAHAIHAGHACWLRPRGRPGFKGVAGDARGTANTTRVEREHVLAALRVLVQRGGVVNAVVPDWVGKRAARVPISRMDQLCNCAHHVRIKPGRYGWVSVTETKGTNSGTTWWARQCGPRLRIRFLRSAAIAPAFVRRMPRGALPLAPLLAALWSGLGSWDVDDLLTLMLNSHADRGAIGVARKALECHRAGLRAARARLWQQSLCKEDAAAADAELAGTKWRARCVACAAAALRWECVADAAAPLQPSQNARNCWWLQKACTVLPARLWRVWVRKSGAYALGHRANGCHSSHRAPAGAAGRGRPAGPWLIFQYVCYVRSGTGSGTRLFARSARCRVGVDSSHAAVSPLGSTTSSNTTTTACCCCCGLLVQAATDATGTATAHGALERAAKHGGRLGEGLDGGPSRACSMRGDDDELLLL